MLKTTLLGGLLLFITQITNAQIDWEILPNHGNEIIQVLNTTPDGTMVGHLPNAQKLYKSTDWGTTWEEIYQLTDEAKLVQTFHSPHSKIIDGDSQGNIYFGIARPECKIMQISLNGDTTIIFDQEPGEENKIRDFGVLPNDNLIIIDNSPEGFRVKINLVTPLGAVVNSTEIDAQGVRLMLGSDSKHHLVTYNDTGTKNTLYEFDTDINQIIEIADLPDLNEPNAFRQIEYLNGRFFTGFFYSDDGANWIEYPNDIEGDLARSKDETIFLLNPDITYYSFDNGQSFDSLLISHDDIYKKGFTNLAETFMPFKNSEIGFSSGNHECVFPTLSITDGWSYQKETLRANKPSVHKIEAASKENLYISEFSTCATCASDYTEEIFEPWPIEARECKLEMISTPSGTAIYDDRIKFSKDAPWESLRPYMNVLGTTEKIEYKKDIIYIADDTRLHSSIDNGQSWQTTSYQTSYDDYYNIGSFKFTAAGKFYYPEYYSSPYLNLLQGPCYSNCEIDIDGTVLDYETDFEKDILYVMTDNSPWGEASRLYLVTDAGNSFIELPMTLDSENGAKIETDIHGNLVVYSKSDIWISSDSGQSWTDINPNLPDLASINDIDFDHENYLYLATTGTPVLRSRIPVEAPMINANDDLSSTKITTYPNPVIDFLNIHTEFPGGEYQIYSTLGEKILEGKLISKSEKIDVQMIQSGAYFITIEHGNKEKVSKKFIKL